jgi:hypothetical protein
MAMKTNERLKWANPQDGFFDLLVKPDLRVLIAPVSLVFKD